MERELVAEITRFVAEDSRNHGPAVSRYFGDPLVGYASAEDPLFEDYREIIGAFHMTPQEVLNSALGPGKALARTVICWVLPIPVETRKSNRREDRYPSRAWAHTRNFGEQFNNDLRRHVVRLLNGRGHAAAAPLLVPGWRRLEDPVVGLASTWSERHAAYAAGLGTFSLNDAMITAAGIAHRLGSVVTDLELPPTPRPYQDRRENCAFYHPEGCGVCIDRCPAGAISEEGHDKAKCGTYAYEVCLGTKKGEYGVEVTGCGLCQTGVPCESRIPAGSR